METLVLNTDYQPLSIIPLSVVSWKDAIIDIVLDKAISLYDYDIDIRSPNCSLKLPSVLLLKEYKKFPVKIPFHKEYVFLRDDYTCQYCGLNAYDLPHRHDILTLDHYIPKCMGGDKNFTNIVTACKRCNLKKSHHQNMHPYTKPYIPSYFEMIKKRKNYPIKISDIRWNEFLMWDDDKVFLKETIDNIEF